MRDIVATLMVHCWFQIPSMGGHGNELEASCIGNAYRLWSCV